MTVYDLLAILIALVAGGIFIAVICGTAALLTAAVHFVWRRA